MGTTRIARILATAAALALAVGCSDDDPNAAPQGQGGAGPKGAAANAAAPEKPAPKPSGPLHSRPGSYPATIEVLPSNRFFVTAMTKDRSKPDFLDAKSIEASIMCDGKQEIIQLVAKPPEGGDGKAARFLGFSNALNKGKAVVIGVTFPSGEPARAFFELAPDYRTY